MRLEQDINRSRCGQRLNKPGVWRKLLNATSARRRSLDSAGSRVSEAANNFSRYGNTMAITNNVSARYLKVQNRFESLPVDLVLKTKITYIGGDT